MSDLEAKRAAAQSVIDWLQEHFPHRREVRLMFVKPITLARFHKGPTLGDFCWGESYDYIRIARNHPEWAFPDTLMHEWAHGITGCLRHTNRWAIAYGRIYRKWYGR